MLYWSLLEMGVLVRKQISTYNLHLIVYFRHLVFTWDLMHIVPTLFSIFGSTLVYIYSAHI